ncbi:hypothetical protein M8J77_000323 [Diaphorina citri]|nr:hypothetical protein M8J77_000323 [Diaphorina citri]
MGVEITTLLDSGAAVSYIGDKGLRYLEGKQLTKVSAGGERVTVANGQVEQIPHLFNLYMKIQDRATVMLVRYLPSLTIDLILGLDAISSLGLVLDGSDDTWHIADRPHLRQKFIHPEYVRTLGCCGLQELTGNERQLLDNLLAPYKDITFPTGSCTDFASHYIDTGDHRPIRQRPYNVNPKMQEVINLEVDKMLSEGVIEPSNSPWSNPIVLVKKPDNSYRFCLDFRKLNEVTVKDAYPLPRIDNVLDSLRNAHYISKLDLKSAYWNIPLAPESREKTAFAVFGRGLFHFTKMAFGLTNAVATFQRFMDRLIGADLAPHAFVYLDDIVIATENLETHLRILELILKRLVEAKLRVNWEKSEFGVTQTTYLGYVIDRFGLQISTEKVQPLLDYPPPKNLKELRRFLGMCSWYRRFIPDFAGETAPLTKLMRKKQRWEWDEPQQAAFVKLKALLASPPILSRPDFSKPFTVQTDASFSGLGSCLTQEIEGKECVIAYASRALTGAELNYTVTEKECLSVLFSVRKFRPYLEGYKFTVITDHSSLRWIQSLSNPTPRLARWAMELSSYDMEIVHRKGALHHVPDALSRIPPESQSGPSEQILVISQLQDSTHPLDIWYRKKYAAVRDKPEKNLDYQILNERLYRRRFDSLELVLEDSVRPWKLVPISSELPRILSESHDASGHFGVHRTYSRVSQHYFWPGMWEQVTQYVRSCESCQRVKAPNQLPTGLMRPRSTEGPWKKVYMDFMGPYPRTSKGNMYILVMQDEFTKWVELVPLRSATADSVVENFRKLVLNRYGCPDAIFSDNGTHFVNNKMAALTSDLGIEHIRAPPYWPQPNMVERTNRDLKQLLQIYTDERQRKWDVALSEFAFVINTSSCSSTGFTPAMLNFGRELEPAKSLWREIEAGNTQRSGPDLTPAQHSRYLANLRDLYELVRVNRIRASQQQSRYYNLRHRDVTYRVGDKVFRRNFRQSSANTGYNASLDRNWLGPFVVASQESPVIFHLSTEEGEAAGRWHVRHLKKCVQR